MTKLKIKLALILLLIFSSSDFCFSQGKHFLEPYANPFIYRLGDINKQFTHIESEFVEVNYANYPSFEFGLQYRFQIKSKIGLVFGLNTLRSKYQLSSFSLYYPRLIDGAVIPTVNMVTYSETVDMNYFGVRLGFNYKLNDRIAIGLSINHYALKFSSNNSLFPVSYSTSITGSNNMDDHSFIFHSEISSNSKFQMVLPELNAEFELVKNLFFNLGIRAKFWGNSDYENIFEVTVNGTPDSGNIPEDVLHHSSASTKGLFMFTGIKYNLPLSFLFKKSVPNE